MAPAMPPTKKVWGDYELHLDQLLGRGGMGAVYRGRQISVDRPVAIKVLKKELATPDFVKRFKREAALLARLVDSHVVQVFGAGEADGEHFFAMEYVEGQDLSSMVKAGRRFSVEELLDITIQTALALKAAWKFKIVHRDIKPSNVLVTRDKQVKVMDFGLAKNPDMDLTHTELIMGTAKYISPEQATGGDVDIRADLYSLGVVLYELATGRAPFVGESPTSVIYQHVHKAPVPPKQYNSSLPESVSAMILRCLAKRPDERYQTPDDLLADAKSIQEGVSIDERTLLLAETTGSVPGPTILSRSGAATMPMDEPTVAKAGPRAPGPEPPPAPGGMGLYVSLAAALLILGGAGWYIAGVVGGVEPPVVDNGGTTAPPPVTTDGLPPVTTGSPPPPPTTAPPPNDAYKERYAEAQRLFTDEKWAAARGEFEKLAREIPRDDARQPVIQDRLTTCAYQEAIGAAEKLAPQSRDLAIAEYQRALAILPAGDVRREAAEKLIKALNFAKWRDSGREKMGKDWAGAAKEFERALPFATGDEDTETREYKRFCERYIEASELLYGRKEHQQARDIFSLLRGKPLGFDADLVGKIGECDAELDKIRRAELAERERKFQAAYDRGKAARAKAQWAAASDAFEEAALQGVAGPPDFAMLRKEARAAKEAPEGMIYLPAATVLFGLGGSEAVEGPQQERALPAFYVDAREVTVGQYRKFLAAKAGHGSCHATEPEDKKQGRHEPANWSDSLDADAAVTGVDWYDAYAYAMWAGKRLPTEAEWERAAGTELFGGAPRRWPWGSEFGKGDAPSACGCEGMGNGVLEWTADWYAAYPGGKASRPEFGETRRALRGGYLSEDDAKEETRVAHRSYFAPDARRAYVGFRCVKAAD